MLKQRIITALLLLPAVFFLIFLVKLDFFAIAIAIITYLMALEWANLAGINKKLFHSFFAMAVSVFNLGILYLEPNIIMWPSSSWPNFVANDLPLIMLLVGSIGIIIASIIVFTYKPAPNWWANKFVCSVLGVILLPCFFVALISIRKIGWMEDQFRGGGLVLLMFGLIWAADTGAYFSGKAFGKHKLAPVVSPNKTWEGVIGGVILSVLIGFLGAYLLALDIQNYLLYTAVLVALALISVVGDLFESSLKRVSGIKDSGQLLPGHGGLLDRLDSTIVVAPLFFLSFSMLGWF